MVLVNVHALASTNVARSAEIPFLNKFARARVIEHLTKHVRGILLYGKGFQPWTLRVDVGGAETVAVCDARIEERATIVIHGVSTHYHLVPAIAIHVTHANLVEGRPASYGVEEFLKLTCGARREIIGNTQVIVMMVATCTTHVPLHHHGGVNAIVVEHTHVSHMFVVLVAHQRGTICAVVMGVIGLLDAGFLKAGQSIDDGDIARSIAHTLSLVVDNAVFVGVGRGVAVDIKPKSFCVGIPELRAVR